MVNADVLQGKVVNESGLSSAQFDLKEGQVTVIVPEDLQVGDTFTGRVEVRPKGDSDKEREKNRKRLKEKYTVEWNDDIVTPGRDGLLKGQVFCKEGKPSLRKISDEPINVNACDDPERINLRVKFKKKLKAVGSLVAIAAGSLAVKDWLVPSVSKSGGPLEIPGESCSCRDL
jgi:hypothetical protein